MLVRGPSLQASMSQYLIEQIDAVEHIEVRTCTEVVGASGRRPPGEADPARPELRRRAGRRRALALRLHRRRAADRLARRRRRPRRPRVRPLGPGSAARPGFAGPDGMGTGTGSVPPGDLPARGVRRRRRPGRVGEARGLRRRRGRDGGEPGAPLVGEQVDDHHRTTGTGPRRPAGALPVRVPRRRPSSPGSPSTPTSSTSPAGEDVCREGEPARCFWVLCRGEIALIRASRGDEVEISRSTTPGHLRRIDRGLRPRRRADLQAHAARLHRHDAAGAPRRGLVGEAARVVPAGDAPGGRALHRDAALLHRDR